MTIADFGACGTYSELQVGFRRAMDHDRIDEGATGSR
jgi:hypothetical protein